MITTTARSPFIQAATRSFSTSSNTLATSESRTTPLAVVVSTVGFQSEALNSWSLALTEIDWVGPSNFPFG